MLSHRGWMTMKSNSFWKKAEDQFKLRKPRVKKIQQDFRAASNKGRGLCPTTLYHKVSLKRNFLGLIFLSTKIAPHPLSCQNSLKHQDLWLNIIIHISIKVFYAHFECAFVKIWKTLFHKTKFHEKGFTLAWGSFFYNQSEEWKHLL